MKHITEDINPHVMHGHLHPDEYEVCEILLQLPRLIAESESRQKLPISWGAKRRRSAMESSPPTSLPQFLHKSAALGPSCETEEDTLPAATAKADASSPSTPLSFSPSESDEKPKRSKSRCPQKRNEEWLGIVDGLTQRRELLKMELEDAKRYYERLKALNIALIARKQELCELSLGLRREETHLVIGSSNLSVESSAPTSKSPAQDNQENHHEIPVINLHQSLVTHEQTSSQRSQTAENYQCPSASLFDIANHNVSPLGIPDLNVSPEETIWMDQREVFDADFTIKQLTTKAVAAEARHRRMQIYRMKNTTIASKFRYDCK